MSRLPLACLAAVLVALPGLATAREYYIREPIEKNGIQIVPNYLEGIEMSKMEPGMSMDPKTIHLECDAHATKDEKHGFAEDAWMPYLTIGYTIEKVRSGLQS